MRIGMTYDLRSDYLAEGFSEDDVAEFDSESTISAIEKTLGDLGHEVERIGHGRRLCDRLVRGDRWDLVFNVAEGVSGRCREAQVPALLEMYNQAYTFSDPLVCAVTLDKAVAKRLVSQAGVPTARFAVVETVEDVDTVCLTPPFFAKPLAEGTGKGIDNHSRIDSVDRLRVVCKRLMAAYRQPVLVEEYLPGREFTTGIIGSGSAARLIGTMEILIRPGVEATDYSYEMKERCESLIEYIPIEKGALKEDVETLALRAYRALECRDAGRADFRLDASGRPFFLEINPLPGIHPTHSDLPMIATMEGMPYEDLIGSIVESALRRTPSALPSQTHASHV